MSPRARLAAAMAAVLFALGGCNDARSHVFSGEPYDTTRGCLEPLQSIDIVAGPEPTAACAPACILSLADDAEPQVVFVSPMCGPYPAFPYDSDAGSDPRCVAGVAAFRRGTLCEPDGGITNPLPDAAAEASLDGGAGDGD